ncbi:MAG: transcription-repair coupling factor [Candidatus Edwardsbacteria bacterium RIFOXYD12_FULL_50_11]|uniref:Transcription-repair-coupling factor n=1 Tax=Candidatus Edwardsbacteria bacterium GWF2_54_11 TaxID=1817851 RepID=A0A1F5RFH9_9BACT|nr:MAG: transcription-repair coupling factor [Candidatus Edwardsbacteria bacterium RifOxyC12_full_54_24]OGF06196.1 MAG: transcription-repair coupling factor [Candidatus Edwardsbacteria bacterium RifOxyA12_full_54_48]OGF12538.1 MAG: transcription-repair coupling factor [Candidatus Edwardsbacteria bacterium GWE2_54_12]OGF12853.1 MAG: transcription-repair coupling factor [Candidatus Edwardsbacteria bacterium GWF2_54_11]OGF17623.1 MAG: transcription-repair coupling factor [Candidatus Edwardsbacteri
MIWDKFSKAVYHSPSFAKLFKLYASDQKLFGLTGPCEAGKPVIVSGLYAKQPRTLLWITPGDEETERQRDNLSVLLGPDNIRWWAAWDILPGDQKEPDVELVGSRMECLQALSSRQPAVILASARAVIQRTVNPAEFGQRRIDLSLGMKIDREELLARLIDSGYERQPAVSGIGDISLRGSIIDIASFSEEGPVRLELDDDILVSLRRFSLLDQRSTARLERATILPRMEVSQRTALLLEHLPENCLVIMDEPGEISSEWAELSEEYRDMVNDNRFASGEQFRRGLATFSRLLATSGAGFGMSEERSPEEIVRIGIQPVEPFMSNLDLLGARIEKLHQENFQIFLLCDNQGQQERLNEIIDGQSRARVAEITVAGLHSGFVFPEALLCAVTEREIFAREKRRRARRFFKGGGAIRSLEALRKGDFMVHVDHGICQYQGLSNLNIEGRQTECLLLIFRDGDKLYLPVDQLKRVQKYSAEEGQHPNLSKLGSAAWEETKARAKRSAHDMAKELLVLYAARKSQPGISFSPDTLWQKELEASFIYQETPDQLRAIGEIKADMESDKPMDRLLCGDVGYGKTEVAIRAAFKAVMDGRQAAVLVPTTVLAEQHYQTFRERLADYPVKVEMLSRFRKHGDQKKVIKAVAAGEVDIVIGTHRLIQKDVQFKKLGLLVVDEEQRFGVAHKEKLKQLFKAVDVLTMTATPIPRTLHMSLLGARDISNIETPPKDRLAVITEVSLWNADRIKEAILREVDRGGQVFFLHNRVQSIAAMTAYIASLVPGAEVALAHGQMEERELERVMLAFAAKRYDVLVATTIIESGLDMPNVNTIIINRADKFGLAQLYQLRGRVGRSNKRAFAHLIIPKGGRINEIARKRLRVIEELSELGSGFQLALRDLEIRGAGNLLGREQHGNMIAVGFELYCQLLEEAVRELKGLPAVPQIDVKVEIPGRALIPQDYVEDPNERINLYRQLNRIGDMEKFDRIREEMSDRFGPPPEEVSRLIEAARLRLGAASLGAVRIKWEGSKLEVWWPEDRNPSREKLEKLVRTIRQPLEFIAAKNFCARIALGSRPDISAVSGELFAAGN